jgi:hypothetical protein
MAQFYQLLASPAPWGDYGDVLRSGLLAPRQEDVRPVVEIERTGPFIPPITFPFDAIVVTEATKARMETGSFMGLQFAPARYVKVVRLDWHNWDLLAPEPQRYPAGGEPENYIIKRRNCDRTTASMPAIWSFDVPSTPGLQVRGSDRFRLNHAPNADIFRENSIHWVSERMRVWLEGNLGDWVQCVPVNPA